MKILSSIAFQTSDPNDFVNAYWKSVGSRHALMSFSWARALFSRYDLLHVQWPEYLVAGKGLRGMVRSVLPLALFLRVRLLRIPVVQTVHNQVAHHGSTMRDELLLKLLDDATVGQIYLNESPENRLAHGAVILHGAYQAPTSNDDAVRIDGRLAVVGALRRYKRLEALIDVVARLGRPDISLQIAGPALDADYAEELAALAERTPSVDLDVRLLSDTDLWSIVRSASLVVLPYRTFYNSGVALLALSAKRPVLVPRTPSSESLAESMGEEWVKLFDHPLTPEDLATALDSPHPPCGPDLSRRRWEDAVDLYDEVLQAAVRARRSRRSIAAARRKFRAQVTESAMLKKHSALNGDIR